MGNYLLISVVSGILFGFMDGFIHANPLAQRLYAVFQPLTKTRINVPVGLVIDLAYGFILAAVFLLLYPSLPGEPGIVKGLSYAIGVWFFRVVMQVASQWMMFTVPGRALLYTLLTGLIEMGILGGLYGLTLAP